MSVNTIGTSSSNLMSLYTNTSNTNQADEANTDKNEAAKKAKKKVTAYSALNDKTYGNTLRDKVRKNIDQMLAGVPRTEGGKLTFNDVFAYKKTLSENFYKDVKADLKGLGVDVETDFKLSYDAQNGKVVVGEHPDREKIMKYFADEKNKEKVEQFKLITQFKSITDTAQKKLSPSMLRKELQRQSMAAWMMNNASGDVFTGNLSLYSPNLSGMNMKV